MVVSWDNSYGHSTGNEGLLVHSNPMSTRHLEKPHLRSYEGSHPWITFRVNLKGASHKFWMLVGEAHSRCQHIAGVPLSPETAERLNEVYLSKGVHATTSIEGNTLTEEQVERQLRGKLALPESQEYLRTEVQNVITACKGIAKTISQKRPVDLTPALVCKYNQQVLSGLDVEEGTNPGKFRRHSVGVGRYLAPPAQDVEFLVTKLCEWLDGPDFETDDREMQFFLAILKVIVAHLYVAWIHPFGDGNGRTARLVEFLLLVQCKMVPLPAGHLLSNHYNKTRSQYYRELEKSSQTEDGVLSFVEYALRGFVDGLREPLDFIRAQQLEVAWQNFVHESFRGDDTATSTRRKHLVLDMPQHNVNRSDLLSVSPRVAREYAKRGEKALSRDLNALVTQGLLIRAGRGAYAANRARILAFLPPVG